MKTALEILKEHLIPYVCCKEYFDHCIDSNNVVTAAPQALKAMEAYAAQFPKSSELPPQPVKDAQPQWVDAKKEMPEIGDAILVHIEYNINGKHTTQICLGYMDDCGELVYLPDDDMSGWEFKDVVTHWCVLPSPPTNL